MRWVAYMPLRGGSKSIQDKNIRVVAGKPLFAWSLEQAIRSGCFDEICVGTDADAIRAAVAAQFPHEVRVLSRSAATCTDEASTESALLEFQAQVPFDVVCLIQATSPCTQANDFRAAKAQFLAERADSLVTATRTRRFFWSLDGRPLNYDPASRPRRQDFGGTYMENGAFYFTSAQILARERCRLGGHISVYEMAPEAATELDEPEDLPVIEDTLRRRDVESLEAKLGRVRGIVVDVDGTLTDGGMYYGPAGEAMKKFNTRDAHGLRLLEQAGFHLGVITAEQSRVVDARMRKLGVKHYHAGVRNKLAILAAMAQEWNLPLSDIAYIGDDLNDFECIDAVGLACCPADAVPEIRARADYVADARAGDGAVREICRLLLMQPRNR